MGNDDRVRPEALSSAVERHSDRPARAEASERAMPAVPRWMPFLLVLGLLGMAARQGFRRIGDPDSWWHLRLGNDVWHNWTNIADPPGWTPFATQHWLATEWLPEVVAGRAEHIFGLPGVVWLFCAALVATVAVLYLVCRSEADTLVSAIATLAAFLGMSATLTPRPQMVSFILLLVVTRAWLRTTRDLRPRWWLIPLSWLWACSHGFWVAGITVGAVVVAGLLLDHRIWGVSARKLLAIPALSVLAAAFTPAGPALLLTPFRVGVITKFITEWGPPSIHDLSPAATAVMIGVVALRWARGRQTEWTRVGLLLTATCWALVSARTVTLAAAMTAPLLAAALQSMLPRSRLRIGRGEVGGLAAAAGAVLGAVAFLLPGSVGTPAAVPSGLNRTLDHLPAHTVIFNDSRLGGWLLWAHPSLEPVIDGRSETFTAAHFEGYIGTSQVRAGWERFLQSTDSSYALVEDHSPLATALSERLHWRPMGTDDGYVLLAAPS